MKSARTPNLSTKEAPFRSHFWVHNQKASKEHLEKIKTERENNKYSLQAIDYIKGAQTSAHPQGTTVMHTRRKVHTEETEKGHSSLHDDHEAEGHAK